MDGIELHSTYLCSSIGNDEPKSLPYPINTICSLGSDGGHFIMERSLLLLFRGLKINKIAQMRKTTHKTGSEQRISVDDLTFVKHLKDQPVQLIFENLPYSKSQCRQDIFVMAELGFKHGGYFVEFGASDGVKNSNTYMMETRFGWHGILAEPARCWHRHLQKSRKVDIETRCVWSKSGETLVFNETDDTSLSTIASFNNADGHADARNHGSSYEVETVSLQDLLRKYDAPSAIDYLSIDTEGSELDILQSFDFDQYAIKIITVEHNYTDNREKIFKLLSAQGYERKYKNLSNQDDWYVKF